MRFRSPASNRSAWCFAQAILFFAIAMPLAAEPPRKAFLGTFNGEFQLRASFSDSVLTLPARVRIQRGADDGRTLIASLEHFGSPLPFQAVFTMSSDQSAFASSMLPSSNPLLEGEGFYRMSKTRLEVFLLSEAGAPNVGSAQYIFKFDGNRLKVTGQIQLSSRSVAEEYQITFIGFGKGR